MPRQPRIDFPGARHHVMNRAASGTAIFVNDDVCCLLVDTLAEVPSRFGARIHAYALMPNHYHLMVETPRGNLSQVMRHVGSQFTQTYNRYRGADGPVFRGRFHNRLVRDDNYWMHLLAYVHLNPVAAGLAIRPEHCLWSSHAAYIGQADRPDWLTVDALIAQFGSREAVANYVEDVRLHRKQAPQAFDERRLWTRTETAAVPDSGAQAARRTTNQALDDVAEVTGVPTKQLFVTSCSPKPHVAPWLAIWWLLRSTNLTQASVASLAHVSRSRVSQINTQLLKLAAKDDTVSDLMATLEVKLLA
ncbi:MAG: REP element-mobilizing transposase RayT [Kiritimatiellia bacterium]|jgi:REP element-mobilizing transposase RayT